MFSGCCWIIFVILALLENSLLPASFRVALGVWLSISYFVFVLSIGVVYPHFDKRLTNWETMSQLDWNSVDCYITSHLNFMKIILCKTSSMTRPRIEPATSRSRRERSTTWVPWTGSFDPIDVHFRLQNWSDMGKWKDCADVCTNCVMCGVAGKNYEIPLHLHAITKPMQYIGVLFWL